MKHLANCTPREFFTQTVKMRKPVEHWLAKIGMKEIRARVPDGYDKMTAKQKEEAVNKQSMENLSEIIWASMEKEPESTLEVLGLCTFSDANADDAPPMAEYMAAVMEMLSNEAVRNFFLLCLKSERTASSKE